MWVVPPTGNRVRQRRILLCTDGPFDNVIKIKPPLVFSRINADQVVDELAEGVGGDLKKTVLRWPHRSRNRKPDRSAFPLPRDSESGVGKLLNATDIAAIIDQLLSIVEIGLG